MKKHILFFLAMVMTSAMFAGTPVSTTKIEVYYFHFTRRCMTCQNVEKVSKNAVETLYAEKVKSGQVSFQSINLDEKTGEAIGAKYKIEGQTLIVIAGDKRVDLTDKGFLYANDSPDKLKAEIKKAVDGFLK
jgi:hypothetical protein